jgi:hypothetical protein
MKTIVIIEWDEPKDAAWLCPENIKLALSAYCPNTKFEVERIRVEHQVKEKVRVNFGTLCIVDNVEVTGVHIYEKKIKYDVLIPVPLSDGKVGFRYVPIKDIDGSFLEKQIQVIGIDKGTPEGDKTVEATILKTNNVLELLSCKVVDDTAKETT